MVFVDGEAGGRSVKYGDLLGDKPFNVKFTGTAPQKPVNRYALVGKRVSRVDIPSPSGYGTIKAYIAKPKGTSPLCGSGAK